MLKRGNWFCHYNLATCNKGVVTIYGPQTTTTEHAESDFFIRNIATPTFVNKTLC